MINSAFPLINIIVRNKSLLLAFLSFCHSVLSNSLWPHELQHTRLPCPSLSPRVCSNSCLLSRWCHPPSHPLLSPSPPSFNLSQHQGFFQWVSCSHQVAKVSNFSFSISPFNNPLQCSCLENPRDGGAWWAAVYGVTQSWTQLKWLSSIQGEIF